MLQEGLPRQSPATKPCHVTTDACPRAGCTQGSRAAALNALRATTPKRAHSIQGGQRPHSPLAATARAELSRTPANQLSSDQQHGGSQAAACTTAQTKPGYHCHQFLRCSDLPGLKLQHKQPPARHQIPSYQQQHQAQPGSAAAQTLEPEAKKKSAKVLVTQKLTRK